MAAVPGREAEDAKRPNREHQSLVGERTRLINQMKATLMRHGIRDFNPALVKAAKQLADLVTAEGMPLPANTLAELRRAMARLDLIRSQIKAIEDERRTRLAAAPQVDEHATMRLLGRVIGLGVETADMLVHEMLLRPLRDRRAVARYGGLTGAPDESGSRRREKGLARSGNVRVRRGMIQFAWRFLQFQKDSPLAQWYRARSQDGRKDVRKVMIVALARKLLVALWRLATQGVVSDAIAMRAAA